MRASFVRVLGVAVLFSGTDFVLSACAHTRPAALSDEPLAGFGEMPEGSFSPARSGPVCKTSCAIPSASDATAATSIHVAAGLEKAMSSLRMCLTTAGAGEVDPIILATYAHDGSLSNATIDLGGIQAAACVERARAVLPERTADASGLLRCSQRCSAVE